MRHLVDIEISISMRYCLEKAELNHTTNGRLLRNYVRNNALCVIAVDFNAKSRKIC